MLISQITAQLNLLIWIPLFSGIVSIIVGIATILKVRHENKEKMASKGFVLDQLSKSETSILRLTKTVDEHKKTFDETIKEHKNDNIREHDSIKKEFNNTVQALDKKFGDLIGLLKDSKSA